MKKERMKRAWAPERVDELCALINTGIGFGDVAKQIGASRSAVCGLVHRLRLAGDPRVGSYYRRSMGRVNKSSKERAAENVDRLADLLADGATLEGAADQIGISMALTWRYFARMRKQLGWQAV